MKDSVKEEIKKIVRLTKFDEPMKEHTTFRVGGPAEVYAEPSVTEIYDLMHFLDKNDIDYEVIGNGSNLLVSDKGIKGLVINISKEFIPAAVVDMDIKRIGSDEKVYPEVADDESMLMVPAGTPLSAAANAAAGRGLTGMEELSGIPGTIGGAVYMNAGAYGGEMKDVVLEAAILCDGQVRYLKNEDLNLSYRHSILDTMKDAVVLSVTFELKEGDPVAIQDKINELNARRREKQPLEYPSAGSTFKRPVGGYASALIESAGLKGISVGGAAVSDKHAGFIINKDDASFHDVKALIKLVQEKVEIESGILLEPEVKIIEQ